MGFCSLFKDSRDKFADSRVIKYREGVVEVMLEKALLESMIKQGIEK